MPRDTIDSSSLNPKSKALRKAVAEYSEKTGINALTISAIVENFTGLLSSHWEHIADSANDEENDGKIGVSIPIKLDFTHKCPVGIITLNFTPKKVSDECAFAVEDPEQMPLPIGSTRRRATSSAIPTAP